MPIVLNFRHIFAVFLSVMGIGRNFFLYMPTIPKKLFVAYILAYVKQKKFDDFFDTQQKERHHIPKQTFYWWGAFSGDEIQHLEITW